ncbi:MAG: radical SAM family heme chaperone HemW [Acidobacteriota bacterium]
MASLGLYVHVPFCASICRYCNFTRDIRDPALEQRYVAAVVGELSRVHADVPAAAGVEVDTIFFGGGTPSLLEPGEIARILSACRRAFRVSADAEITLEANPESIDEARAAAYRAAGATRLSLGVQSFSDDDLQRLGRAHDAGRARRAVADARAAGFSNISLDLMMWLPQQSIEQWMASVETLIDEAPEHASLYMLELYPNAPLREEMARSKWSAASDDDAAEMYERAMARLERAGYRQYEISNVARPGLECRHNLKYWTDGEWLGFGPGAHSTVSRTRWKNVPGIADYVSRIEAGRTTRVEPRHLSPVEACQEALITGLRLTAGVDESTIARNFGLDLWARYGHHLQPYLDEGLLVHGGGRIRLTRRGMLLANEILAVFI